MRFSPILSLYIGRHFVGALAGAMGVIMGLIYLFDVIELLRRTATRGDATFPQILELAFYKLPQMIQVIMPFGVMVGAMVCFLVLTRSRELVVTRSAGVSAWEILAPVLGIVLMLGVVNVTAFNPLSAALYLRYERLQDQMALRGNSSTEGTIQVGEAGLWLREVQPDQVILVHANAVRQEGFELKLREVSVLVSGLDGTFRYRLEAVLGTLADHRFRLTDVRLLRAEHPVQPFATYEVPTELTLARVQDNFTSPETMSFWQLPGFIAFFEAAGFSANRQKLYFQSLLSSPLLLCAMVLVAAVFTLRPDTRSGGLMVRLICGVVSGFVFYFFSRVVYALGLSATLPVILSAWTPALVAGLIGLAALFHLEDG